MTEPIEHNVGGAHISYEVQGLDALLAKIPGEGRTRRVAYNVLRRIGMAIEGQAKLRIRSRTGATRRTITSTAEYATLTGFVGDFGPASARARVALYLEKGTGIYGPLARRIFPTHARALSWPIGASGAGFERADMGLHMTSGLHGPTLARRTLRRTGSHTAAYERSGNASFAHARSIAGMRRQPFFIPAYVATLPMIPVILEEAGRAVFDERLGIIPL